MNKFLFFLSIQIKIRIIHLNHDAFHFSDYDQSIICEIFLHQVIFDIRVLANVPSCIKSSFSYLLKNTPFRT